MSKSRLEAFTDGVVSIVLTLLVLTIQIPDAPTWQSLWKVRLIFFAYVVSFGFVAVIWVAHHRLFQLTDYVNDKVVWANIFWLFWLTLSPAVTIWVGQHPFDVVPNLAYVFIFTMWSVSFEILVRELLKIHRPDSKLARVLRHDRRSLYSDVINVLIFIGVFFVPIIGLIGRFFVTALWVFPYRIPAGVPKAEVKQGETPNIDEKRVQERQQLVKEGIAVEKPKKKHKLFFLRPRK
ncbi:MAG: DUF1211 domain-containing protein [Lactobacillus sp.]|jgi:uncharacterized membrane protein|nr:DUF1211 domain-containing protein [Lentilactobacillus hilgardii]RRG12190.1 MAG: DUF1211 domain-containing protein [Lactobacillus sp.]